MMFERAVDFIMERVIGPFLFLVLAPFSAVLALALMVGLALAVISPDAHAKRLNPEKFYQDRWCNKVGETEVLMLDRTRVDCLTSDYAIEFDFADKWAESIGQAIHYARLTNKHPGIVLILEDPKHCYLAERLASTLTNMKVSVNGGAQHEIVLWLYGPAATACLEEE